MAGGVARAGQGVPLLEPQVSQAEAALLARAEAISNRVSAAEMLLKKAAHGGSPALDFAAGNFFFQAGKSDEAEAAYRQALKKLPTFRRAANNLARLYLQEESPAEAQKVCQAVVERGIADSETLLLLGHSLLMQSRYIAAETAFRQVLMLNTESLAARQGLAKCLLAQDRYKEARSLLKSVLTDHPQYAEFWNLLANLEIELKNNPAAISALESARLLGCITLSMRLLLGDLYLDGGQSAAAVAAYTAAMREGATDMHHLLRAADALTRMGDAARAEQLLAKIEKVPGFDGGSPEYLAVKAALAALQGAPDEAAKLYRQILAEDPLNGGILLKLGGLLDEQGAIEEAALCYERAARCEGDAVKADALVGLAQQSARQGDYTKAVSLLEQAQKIRPRENVARYLRQVRRE